MHDEFAMGFPLPFFLVFLGYALILFIDKVAFDTHSMHSHGDDLAEKKLLSAATRLVRQSSSSRTLEDGVSPDKESEEEQKK